MLCDLLFLEAGVNFTVSFFLLLFTNQKINEVWYCAPEAVYIKELCVNVM